MPCIQRFEIKHRFGIYIYIYIYILYLYVYVCVCMCMYVCVYIYIYIYVCITVLFERYVYIQNHRYNSNHKFTGLRYIILSLVINFHMLNIVGLYAFYIS